jgi:phosphomannomutase
VNFRVKDADAAIAAVRAAYSGGAELDEMDGLSLSHAGWRLNVRKSNTEPLLRINIEVRGATLDLHKLVSEIADLIWAGESVKLLDI